MSLAEKRLANLEVHYKSIGAFYGLQSNPVEQKEPNKKYYEKFPEEKITEEKTPRGNQIIGKIGGHQIINYRGFKIPVGGQYGTIILDKLFGRIHGGESCIVLISGSAGKGKSWLALRLAEILDHRFSPIKQVVFTREQFLHLVSDDSPLRKHQVILIDEAQFSVSNRRWYEDIQKDLTEQLEAIRFKGYVLIIVTLHSSLIDSIIREHLINFQMIVEKRGVASVYETRMHRFKKLHYFKKLGVLKLQVPDFEHCKNPGCLDCKYSGLQKQHWAIREKWIENPLGPWGLTENGFNPCSNLRCAYERLKKSAVQDRNRQTQEKMQDSQAKRLKDDEIVQLLIPHLDKIEKKKDGKFDVGSLQAVCSDQLGITISHVRSYALRDKLQRKLEKIGGVS